MANRAAHQLAGAFAGFAVWAADHPERESGLHRPFAAGTLGAVLARLPDLIEPATNNPHHRQFFHSVVVAGAVMVGVRKLFEWAPEDDLEKLLRGVLLVGGAAYLSHLALDAVTSRSLPLVGKL